MNRFGFTFEYKSAPEPVLLKEKINLLDWHLLRFRQEEEHKQAHYQNQASEQQEDPIPEMAKRHQEALCHNRREDHIHTHHHTLCS